MSSVLHGMINVNDEFLVVMDGAAANFAVTLNPSIHTHPFCTSLHLINHLNSLYLFKQPNVDLDFSRSQNINARDVHQDSTQEEMNSHVIIAHFYKR